MQLRNKFYPYPVIIENGGYYVNSSFDTDVEQVIEGYNIKLIFNARLVNAQLYQMMQEGLVEIVHHIECPQTCFRKCIKTRDQQTEYLIRDAEINGNVQVCTFLVARHDIPRYTNELFSSDYRGFKFDIEKGCIMAVGNQVNLLVNKMKDDLANTSSIFSIVPNIDPLVTNIKINLNENKIVIMVPEKTYGSYYNMQGYIDVQPVMHSMLIIPALMYALIELREGRDQLYEYEDYRWFRGLKKTCSKMNITLDKDGLENIDVFEISQKLLDSPISRAVEFLVSGGSVHED